MSLYGYYTKKDLTKLGSLCLMALVGLILASVVNIFLRSEGVYWLTTYAGILIFVGLTAYDTQKLKKMAAAEAAGADVARKAEEDIARAVAAGGLGARKARTIKAVLNQIKQDHGSLSLKHLAGLPPDEVRRYLTSLPGVGPKTAACVQLFALGQASFPVDTHVHRVASRLGLIGGKFDAVRAQNALEGMVEPADCLPLHLLMIRHGRRICRPAKPKCDLCPLALDCSGCFIAGPDPSSRS